MVDTFYRNVLLPPVRRLTRKDAETAHEWYLMALRAAQKQPWLLRAIRNRTQPYDPCLAQDLLDGLSFPTPFGIAAGLDKNAAVYSALEALVTPGFIEIGTVTREPQVGNPRPRIVRVGNEGLINAMGFPNEGMNSVVSRLTSMTRPTVPLGLNIGKMKDTAEADAPGEYAEMIRQLEATRQERGLPDFYVVNVSSPNTPGLRDLQAIGPLTEILEAVTKALDEQSNSELRLRRRLLVKLSPDLSEPEVEGIVELVNRFDIGGIIQTNTTLARPVESRYNDRPGGFSGSALYDRSAQLVRFTAGLLPRDRVLVATGGIDTVNRAYEMLRYADLIGSYTGLVLDGPGLLRRLARGVTARMRAADVKTLRELRHDQRPL